MIGVFISEEEYRQFEYLKKKNTEMQRVCIENINYCPICHAKVELHSYCSFCGQSLKG